MQIGMTLYKKDSKGKTRVWQVDATDNQITVSTGVLNGAMVHKVTKAKPKNQGRANATTAEQQALKEAIAKHEKKLKRDGYTIDQHNLDYNQFIQPMLARDYHKVSHQLDWGQPVYASAKLDGVRAIWIPGKGFQSRKGTFYKVPHLEKLLRHTTINLDGELYIHGFPLNQIVRAVKKPNGNTHMLEFRVFDVVPEGTDTTHSPILFSKRIEFAKEAVKEVRHQQIKLVHQDPILQEFVDSVHDDMVKLGYEGIMLRTDGPYTRGQRSPDLFKYKKFLEDDFEVLGVEEDKDGNGVFLCDGFKVRMKGTNEERRHHLDNPDDFIGRMLTVRYFTLTEFGKPQFPVGITLRDDI
jgi:DNA ligase-1